MSRLDARTIPLATHHLRFDSSLDLHRVELKRNDLVGWAAICIHCQGVKQ